MMILGCGKTATEAKKETFIWLFISFSNHFPTLLAPPPTPYASDGPPHAVPRKNPRSHPRTNRRKPGVGLPRMDLGVQAPDTTIACTIGPLCHEHPVYNAFIDESNQQRRN